MSKEQEEMQQATEEHIEQPLPDEPKEEQSEPMGILTSRAHEDMTLAILQVQAAYGLPAYLTDLIVTAVLADIRGCANKDLLNSERRYRLLCFAVINSERIVFFLNITN